MFRYIMQFLRSPDGGELKLDVFTERFHPARKENEIIEGVLINKRTGKVYPIVNGIPRMLPTSLTDNIDFCKKYRKKLAAYNISFSENEIKRFTKANHQVKSRFEFQWRTWGRAKRVYGMSKEEYKHHIFVEKMSRPLKDSFFKGKVFFEGGCGHGIVSQFMSPICEEYIGLDLGEGIDCARWRSKDLPNVHLIQGDLLKLPLKMDSIDFVLSNGVIHHTPDTYRSFVNLSKLTKKGGHLMIWVYPKGNFLWEYTNRFARFFTTRLPPRLLYYLCYPMIPILYIFPAWANNRPGKNTAKELTQSIYDWLSPKIQTHHTRGELISWYRKNGYSNIEPMRVDTGAIATRIN